jgi:hypothetical protein
MSIARLTFVAVRPVAFSHSLLPGSLPLRCVRPQAPSCSAPVMTLDAVVFGKNALHDNNNVVCSMIGESLDNLAS